LGLILKAYNKYPVGSKAKCFEEALGFTKANLDDLAKHIIFDLCKAVETATTEFGIKYNQTIKLLEQTAEILM